MYIVINDATYSDIINLSFSPETDVTGSEVPINGFTVDIITTAVIDTGVDVYLYDDEDTLWAKFWLIDSYLLDDTTVRIIAQSLLAVLDRITLPAVMYNSVAIATVIESIFAGVSSIYGETVIYSIDSSFNSETISGYAPQQSARERLQWVLMCIGAYCNQVFTEYLQFLPVSDNTVEIPKNVTYYRPQVEVSDYVTAVTVVSYSYAAGTPTSTDKYVEVNGNYYIQTAQSLTLVNDSAPQTAPENVILIDKVTLINESNVSGILSRLATYYFKRGEVDAEVINNGEYLPGQKAWIMTDEQEAYAGFIRSLDFTFGLQTKSRIRLTQTDQLNLLSLTIICLYGNTELKRQVFYLPEDYAYRIENLYIEIFTENYHTVYYPLTPVLFGTLTEETEVEVEYEIALDEYLKTYVLTVANIDNASQEREVDVEVVMIS